MSQSPGGSYHLFRAFGINVHLHWTWLILVYVLVAFIDLGFPNRMWNLGGVLAIFGIVLLHEFGHSLACRSVGGRAEHIILWPLGGVAFVQPPPRPGPVLWSIAAGPLVNVVLAPILYGIHMLVLQTAGEGDLASFTQAFFYFNLVILIFNMLPIYPLDGGQILHALLWFVIGRANALRIAAGLGLLLGLAGAVWALTERRMWLLVIAGFVVYQAWIGLQHAGLLSRMDKGHRD